jgi:hypothetical protein
LLEIAWGKCHLETASSQVCDPRADSVELALPGVGSMDGALCFTAVFSRRPHARMPFLIFGVGIAEPPPAGRAVHRRRITARLIVRRHALTQALQVRAFRFLFFHRHTS